MDKQNLMPQPAQPVNRVATGQLPPELAELSEEALSLGAAAGSGDLNSASVLPSMCGATWCSYDGDDAE